MQGYPGIEDNMKRFIERRRHVHEVFHYNAHGYTCFIRGGFKCLEHLLPLAERSRVLERLRIDLTARITTKIDGVIR